MARNCHIVLSDLQQTVRLNRDTPLHSPSHGVLDSRRSSSFRATGRQLSHAAGDQTPDQSSSSKRRRIDPDTHAGRPFDFYSGGLQPQRKGSRDEIRRQVDQTCAPGSGEAAALNSVIDDPASRLTSEFPSDGQPIEPLALNQPHLQQEQPISLPPHGAPIAVTPGLDAMGSSMPGFGSNDNGQMGGSTVGNWDGGMLDILGGVTWESLLDVVDQDNLAWRGGFL